jgi:Peptidase A4 family
VRLSRSVFAAMAVLGGGLTVIGTAAPALAGGVQFGGPIVIPNIPAPGAASSRAATTLGGATIQTLSYNWSGYGVLGKDFNYVSATFTEPTVTCTNRTQFTSEWVGLDGATNSTVEQDGTGVQCAGPGGLTPYYYAWYEMFPAGSVLTFPVSPGDVISASVKYSAGNFALTIADLTTGASYTDTATCATCARSSAEWINERPAYCNNALTKCALTELAQFSPATMGYALAGTDTISPQPIGAFPRNYDATMVDPITGGGFQSLDNAGPLLGPVGSAYTATWYRTGNPFPISL